MQLIMERLFGGAPWPRKLPDRVQRELVGQFREDPDRVGELRYVQRLGEFAGRQVRYVRIFDPGGVPDPEAIKHYEQAADDCVLFGGYLEMDGTPRLTKVREAIGVS